MVEHAVDQRHDGEIPHRLARQLRLAAQHGDEIGWFHRRQRPDVREVAAAQQIAPGRQHARGVGVGDRVTAGQRHLAHGAQDGVTFTMANFPHR